MTTETRCLSIAIDCPQPLAYAWLAIPENFPLWAAGLATSLEEVDGEWVARSPVGSMKIRFSPRNDFGVLDHWVYPESGGEIYVPLRVVANGRGCELSLTLFRQPGMDDARFAADAELVRTDLRFAKKILEAGPGSRAHQVA
ncbi:MAG: SRPBCC family protein [Chromatiales bacterium]|nr:SRPBCC family protein [Chromatiales bacterium]